jgi:hypothetical protein
MLPNAGSVALTAGRLLVASGSTSGNGDVALQVQWTSDDGRHWQQSAHAQVAVTEVGASLALKTDDGADVAWLVTPFELWLSHDAGRAWARLAAAAV